jgi:SAM-dependent methyltransferase
MKATRVWPQRLGEGTQELAAFHAEFDAELKSLLDLPPVAAGMTVLDAACGDGFYLSALEEKVGPSGLVLGLDASLDTLREMANADKQKLIAGTVAASPLARGRLDAVLCCQSLFSLPEPVQTLATLAELVRPGGAVVVIENDSLHQLLLPWPPELELAVRAAEYASFREKSPHPRKFYVGRHLPACLRAAGLEPLGFATRTMDRAAPLQPAAERFLRLHLRQLHMRVADHLAPDSRRELDALLGSDSGHSWFRDPSFTFTWLNVVAWARKPVD